MIWNLQREGFKHVQGDYHLNYMVSVSFDGVIKQVVVMIWYYTERVLNGHRRAVNRICWHTTDWNVLISGSQDGTIKIWVRQ